jgi:nucleoside-diphosphate-sugar epimerase
MEVLVTGGAGFLGRRVCEKLKDNGHTYDCLAMEGENTVGLKNVIIGDITRPDDLIIPNVDGIIHCAGILESSHPTEEQMMKVNFEGTKNIFEKGRINNIRKFIFISTVSVIGPKGTKEKPITEDFELDPYDPYGRSKLSSEQYLKKMSNKNGIQLTILRPSVLYGPGMNLNSSGMKVFTSIDRGIMPLVGDGSTILNMLYVDNLVHAILLALESTRSFSIFNVSEGPYSQKKVIEVIEKRMGKIGHKRYPKPLLWLLTLISELANPFFKGPPPLSWTKYRGLTTSSWNMSSALIRKELGHEDIVTLEEGVDETCSHYGW